MSSKWNSSAIQFLFLVTIIVSMLNGLVISLRIYSGDGDIRKSLNDVRNKRQENVIDVDDYYDDESVINNSIEEFKANNKLNTHKDNPDSDEVERILAKLARTVPRGGKRVAIKNHVL